MQYEKQTALHLGGARAVDSKPANASSPSYQSPRGISSALVTNDNREIPISQIRAIISWAFVRRLIAERIHDALISALDHLEIGRSA